MAQFVRLYCCPILGPTGIGPPSLPAGPMLRLIHTLVNLLKSEEKSSPRRTAEQQL